MNEKRRNPVFAYVCMIIGAIFFIPIIVPFIGLVLINAGLRMLGQQSIFQSIKNVLD